MRCTGGMRTDCFRERRINQTVCGKMTLEDTEEVDPPPGRGLRAEADFPGRTGGYTCLTGGYGLSLCFGRRRGRDTAGKSGWMWLPAMFSPREYEVGENVDFNREMLGEFVDSLPQLDQEQMTAPEDCPACVSGGRLCDPAGDGRESFEGGSVKAGAGAGCAGREKRSLCRRGGGFMRLPRCVRMIRFSSRSRNS